MRIIVIGGGVIGLCTALALSREGADVTVLGRGEPGGGASLCNAGWVVPVMSGPLAAPGVAGAAVRRALGSGASLVVRPRPSAALLRWCLGFLRSSNAATHRAGLAAMLGLGARSCEQYTQLRDSGVEFEIHPRGLLFVARTQKGLHEAAELVASAERAGYPGSYRQYSAQEARSVEPALGEGIVGAVHAQDELHVRPETLVAGLRAALRSKGVEIRERAEVHGIVSDGSRGWSVRAGKSTETADRVVIAAGTWSRELLRGLGVRVPLQGGKGYSITSTGAGTAPRHPMKLIEANIACSPFDAGLRVSGMFELGARDGRVNPRLIRRILSGATRYLHDWQPEQAGLRLAGMRPSTPDGLPLIGSVPGRAGVYVATGHGTLGLTLAPATAAALAPLVLHGRLADELTPFAVERFATGGTAERGRRMAGERT
ncbi:FAD-dependent oxidoreductase [Streptomyces oryzae]|uniref:FAD-dependent oxidoreductase n=1 Tax=Streptomyces oryzae TaxID=1434886 RepID=A0ABS3X7M9_9ACTN|nr:FAD-dependent oxidoreductase [Streptomyces oryzae]MBO8191091.1 FAD-dependent oxidoreductase [Streptomyces oryzae]